MDMFTRLFSSPKPRSGTHSVRCTRILVQFGHCDNKPFPQLKENPSESGGFLGATDSAVPCAQMLNLAHAMDRDLKEHGKNKASPF